jgi:hypothetical protein
VVWRVCGAGDGQEAQDDESIRSFSSFLSTLSGDKKIN